MVREALCLFGGLDMITSLSCIFDSIAAQQLGI
jgi:hypothetical protein